MTIIWGGILALVLIQLNRNNIEHVNNSDSIKRIGVYYICIEDLLM